MNLKNIYSIIRDDTILNGVYYLYKIIFIILFIMLSIIFIFKDNSKPKENTKIITPFNIEKTLK